MAHRPRARGRDPRGTVGRASTSRLGTEGRREASGVRDDRHGGARHRAALPVRRAVRRATGRARLARTRPFGRPRLAPTDRGEPRPARVHLVESLPVTTYPMSDADREIQERARRFVDDELIPLEVETELQRREAPGRRAREAPPHGDRPRAVGDEHAEGARRRRPVDVPAGAGVRADRPGHQRVGVGASTPPPAWAPAVVIGGAARTVDPARRSAASATSATRSPRRARAPTSTRSRRPHGGTATCTCSTARRWHVDLVRLGRLRLLPGQDRRWPERRLPRDVLRRRGHARGSSGPRARVHAHVRGHARESSRSRTSACR